MTKFCVTVKIFQPKVVYGHEKEGESEEVHRRWVNGAAPSQGVKFMEVECLVVESEGVKYGLAWLFRHLREGS